MKINTISVSGLILLLVILPVSAQKALSAVSDGFNVSLNVVEPGSNDSGGGVIVTDGDQGSGDANSGGAHTGGDNNDQPPPDNSADNHSGSGAVDPFDLLPRALDHTAHLTLQDFIFSQVGELPQTFNENGVIRINGQKYLTIQLPYERAPEVLKTIGMTVFDPADPGASLSFYLRIDPAKEFYTATLAPLEVAGLYPFNIHLLNYQNQSVQRLRGSMQVSGRLLPIGFVPASVTDTAVPLAIGTGVLVGVSSAVLATGASSLYEVYLLLVRGIGALFGLFGYRRKRRPWGTVYDAVTKRPLDPVYVSVIDVNTSKEVASAITDIDGRYSLFLPPGTYRIVASKSHYRFPSQILTGRAEDELYANLYFGGGFAVTGSELTTLNIPLDPIGFDWNEFTKDKNKFFRLFSRRDILKARLAHWLYGLGFALALGSMLFAPSWLNVLVILVYAMLYAFRFIHRANRRAITVRSAANGQPLPFAVVRVFLPGVEQEIKTVVADAFGRLHLLVRPGTYTLAVDEKSAGGGYQRLYQSPPLELAKGVLKTDILV